MYILAGRGIIYLLIVNKELVMKNYVTGREYTGVNAETLAAAGVDAVVTFNQAVKDLGIAGAKLKGLKACAKLVFFKNEEDKDGNEVKKPKFFSVFDVAEVLARKVA